MKNSKKITALALALFLALALMSACAPTPKTPPNTLTVSGYFVAEKVVLIDNAETAGGADVTALDVIKSALHTRGFSFSDDVYIHTVTTPDGISYAATDSGGWLFAVNGAIPEVGAADCIVAPGDHIDLRFVADYNTGVDWATGQFID